VEDTAGHIGQEALRFLVVHSRSLAQQASKAAATAQTQEAVQVEAQLQRVTA
jgi:hypothetical protein